MAITFAGELLPYGQAIARHYHGPKMRRTSNVPMPQAWKGLLYRYCQIANRNLIWKTWQAVSTCPYSEVRTLRYQFLWGRFGPTFNNYTMAGITPRVMITTIELLVISGYLTITEGRYLEEGMLQHVNTKGDWTLK